MGGSCLPRHFSYRYFLWTLSHGAVILEVELFVLGSFLCRYLSGGNQWSGAWAVMYAFRILCLPGNPRAFPGLSRWCSFHEVMRSEHVLALRWGRGTVLALQQLPVSGPPSADFCRVSRNLGEGVPLAELAAARKPIGLFRFL